MSFFFFNQHILSNHREAQMLKSAQTMTDIVVSGKASVIILVLLSVSIKALLCNIMFVR